MAKIAKTAKRLNANTDSQSRAYAANRKGAKGRGKTPAGTASFTKRGKFKGTTPKKTGL